LSQFVYIFYDVVVFGNGDGNARNINFLKASEAGARMIDQSQLVPSEGIKLATCIVTIGPIVFVYPFVQKYFVKGIMIGAIKG
jgi:putative aldouronate transport system permease protein